jgi:hypothetical protein
MARAQILHWIAVGLIMMAVVCFLLVPVLGNEPKAVETMLPDIRRALPA